MESGTRLGPYEILEQLGAGGMGEVYRARDTKLDRDVAVKVLPASFASDPDRLVRFEREAKTLASLNHPNIAQVFGLEQGDATVIVMELVEGEDLSHLIERGPVPLEDAVAIARQIANALAEAHEAGIVHRDLKPANVRVRADGTVKVLDFGLAKAGGSGSGSSAVTNSPTLMSPGVTEVGMILGTAAYMSPEQAKGRVVDRRADVWAFGCVLLELLTGRRAFDGDDVTEVLAGVIKDKPPFEALPADTPESVRRLLRRCLQKDPATRLDSMRAARLDLDEAETAEGPRDAAPARDGWRHVAVGVAAALLLALAGVAYLASRGPAPADTALRLLDVELPDGTSRFSLSPNGRVLAAFGSGGLQVRDLSQADWRTLDGEPAAGFAGNFAWAPDSRRFVYRAANPLRVGDILGAPPRTICDACLGNRTIRGVSWNGRETVLIGSTQPDGLLAVDVDTGDAKVVTRLSEERAENSHRYPFFLPDGRRYLFVARADTGEHSVLLASLDGDEPVPLLSAFSEIAYADGHVLFVRAGTLFAQRLDEAAGAVRGDPIPIATDVDYFIGTGMANFGAGIDGTLIYRQDRGARRLAWFDRQGRLDEFVDMPPWRTGGIATVRSFEGRRFVTEVLDPSKGSADVYVFDSGSGAQTRLTSDPRWDQVPIWAHDGRAVLYVSNRVEGQGVYIHPLDGAPERLIAEGRVRRVAASPNGIDVLVDNAEGIWRYDLAEPDRHSLWQADAGGPTFSADGRWVAYVSGVSGSNQLYVGELDGQGRERIATGCDVASPAWSASSDEVFFFCNDEMYAVPVRVGARLVPGTPEALFSLEGRIWARGGFDVDAQGRFLARSPGSDQANTATVVLNWQRLLEQPR